MCQERRQHMSEWYTNLRHKAAICSVQISGKHPEERWTYEHRSEQEDECGWGNWGKMSWVPCNNGIPLHAKGMINKMIIQRAMLCDIDAVAMSSSHVISIEVTRDEGVQMGMFPHSAHTLIDHCEEWYNHGDWR